MAIDSKRIAKNTAVLYLRMILLMVVALYTSRVVLEALGVEDFGTYNVVGGVVAVLGFMNSTMSTASSRFIAVSLGDGNIEKIRQTFNALFYVILALIVLVFIASETIGLWFLLEKMVIPDGRMNAAIWVYQFSVVTVLITIAGVPYDAAIIANEKMNAFAYISLFDGFAKLVAAILILYASGDRLIIYAACLMIVHVVDVIFRVLYCKRKVVGCEIAGSFDRNQVKQILKFVSWSAYGSFATAGFTHGLNIVLNLFFGPVVNAARSIAVQVQNASLIFTSNFQTAINPQLMMNTSQKDYESTKKLFVSGSKLSFILLCVLGMPIMAETHYILKLWLGEVPDFSVSFCKIMVIISIWSCLDNPLRVVNQAEGNIRKFQLYECTILLLIVPISYFILKLYALPIVVFYVHLIVELLAQIVRLKIVLPKIRMSIKDYICCVYIPVIPVFFIPIITYLILNFYLEESILRLIFNFTIIELLIILITIAVGLNRMERNALFTYVSVKMNRNR